MRVVFFILSVIGWLLSLVVHVLSVMHIDVEEYGFSSFYLHLGVFVAFLPALLLLVKENKTRKLDVEDQNPIAFLKKIFVTTPVWMVVIIGVLFIYSFVNFYLTSTEGVTGIIDGKYVLHNHGDIIKELTEQEYHYYEAESVRSFSGMWLFFYGLAAAILYPFGKIKEVKFEI